ncbi:prephenate dehydrogenase [Peptidiphaga sp.]|uniref:prephenate dehydrogenase n=1 Tax=Peptidiphaga sp. TaxID=2848648 RepID=UPI0036071B1D
MIPSPVRIVGSGLLGASLGLRLRQLGARVQLEDASPASAALARDLGAGDIATADSPAPQLVVVATPPDVSGDVVKASLDRFPEAVVTDVASVKARIVGEVTGHPGAERYAGSHPMAGRERSGAIAADADLFVGRPWVITPVGGLQGKSEGGGRPPRGEEAVRAVQRLALAVGSLPVVMDAAAHDTAAAVVSHMPQLIASLVAGELRSAPAQALELAGQGLRDVTRIAHSDSRLWAAIIAGNAPAVAASLRGVAKNLDALIAALDGGEEDPFAPGVLAGVSSAIRRGNDGVARIPGKHGGAPRRYAGVFVLVPDEPGRLGRLLTEVGQIGVNIEDLQLEHSLNQKVGRAMISVLPGQATRLAVALERRGWQAIVEGKEHEVGTVIAVDGPSGSGKSTVSRAVARRLGLGYLDTGAMYRALAWWCAHEGVDLDDREAVAAAAASMPLEMSLDPDDGRVCVAGVDVSRQIRTPGLSKVVSKVATNLKVREELVRRQRAIVEGARYGIVAEGRDITTVVAPDADVRVLLTASKEARLARRALETRGSADAAAVAATRDEVLRRDADDSAVAEFLTAADGVTRIDSSAMGVEEVVEAVVSLVPEGGR